MPYRTRAQRVDRAPDLRPSAASRGYDANHRRWRSMVLSRDPICRLCEREPSTEADHIVPLSHGGGWSLENGQGLCKTCHSRKTARERQR